MTHKKVFIIAEAGVNHNGDLSLAKKLIDVAKESGADAVKFQIFSADELASSSAPKAGYQVKTTSDSDSQKEMLKKLELSRESFSELKKYADQKKILFLATPFDLGSVDLLDKEMNVPMFKVASGDITFAALLHKIALTGKPLIISTGMANLQDIEEALQVLAFGYLKKTTPKTSENFKTAFESQEGQAILAEKLTILHCTTQYPAPYSELNLNAMRTIQQTFKLPVGYSDHSMGIHVPVAAVAMGATLIEKHFTLDRTMKGPDHSASLEPHELKNMVTQIREIESALGNGEKKPSPSELPNRDVARRSLTAACDIAAGELFTEKNLISKRPGNGTSPMKLWDKIGTKATKNLKKDELI